jgi:hypothetical protein
MEGREHSFTSHFENQEHILNHTHPHSSLGLKKPPINLRNRVFFGSPGWSIQQVDDFLWKSPGLPALFFDDPWNPWNGPIFFWEIHAETPLGAPDRSASSSSSGLRAAGLWWQMVTDGAKRWKTVDLTVCYGSHGPFIDDLPSGKLT